MDFTPAGDSRRIGVEVRRDLSRQNPAKPGRGSTPVTEMLPSSRRGGSTLCRLLHGWEKRSPTHTSSRSLGCIACYRRERSPNPVKPSDEPLLYVLQKELQADRSLQHGRKNGCGEGWPAVSQPGLLTAPAERSHAFS